MIRTIVEEAWEIAYLAADGIGIVLAPNETVAGLVAGRLDASGAIVLAVERMA